jgi:ligand-binding SRPBCC domain-containing protein
MAKVELTTRIDAPIDRCFDLALSIDLHMDSVQASGERAIKGIQSGLIGLNETVTWRGKHFGITWEHTSRVTDYERPKHFRDIMVKGAFKFFIHDHYFSRASGMTVMKDVLLFEAPFGTLGTIVDGLILRAHMNALLMRRNDYIKRVAESENWRKYLLAANHTTA